MREACNLVWSVLVLLFQSRASLGAEIVILRHQLNIQPATAPAKETDFQCHGSPDLCWAVSFGAKHPQCTDDCEAGDCRPLASRGFPAVLVLEVETPWWPADGTAGNTPAHPGNEHRKSTLGSCVKKTRERHAVRKMKEDPSEPSCRGRLQTAISCFGQKPRW